MHILFSKKIIPFCIISILLSLLINLVLLMILGNVKTIQVQASDIISEDEQTNTSEVFSFEDFFDESTILYRDNGNGPYFLALSQNNSPRYIINKECIKKFKINKINIDQCTINILNSDIVKFDNIPLIMNCDDYTVLENKSTIIINSKYETPINSSKVTVSSETMTRSIPIYNTLNFDQSHPLNPLIWKFDAKHNPPPGKKIIFFSPQIRDKNFLSLERNISKNFTAHISIEPRTDYPHALPVIQLNDDVLIDFGYKDGTTLHIHYKTIVNGKDTFKDAYEKIDKRFFSAYYRMTISKFNSTLKILFSSEKYTDGEFKPLFEKSGIFLSKPWSSFAIGNTKKRPGFELQSIMLVGREDEQE